MTLHLNSTNTYSQLLFVIAFLFLSSTSANSQTIASDSIIKQKYVVVEKHKTYERILEKGYESIELFEYLANYYYNCNECEKSKMYFDILFKKYSISKISANSISLYNTFKEKKTVKKIQKKPVYRKS